MAGLVPAIHVLLIAASKTWMPGTSPGMTPSCVSDKLSSGHSARRAQFFDRRIVITGIAKNLGVDADAVVIQINEAPLAHKMKGGKTFVERAAAQKK